MSKQLVKCIRPSVPVTVVIPNPGGSPTYFEFESAGTIVDVSSELKGGFPQLLALSWDAESGVPNPAVALMLQGLQNAGAGAVRVYFDFPNKVIWGDALVNLMRPDMVHFIGDGPLHIENSEVFYGEAGDNGAAE